MPKSIHESSSESCDNGEWSTPSSSDALSLGGEMRFSEEMPLGTVIAWPTELLFKATS